MFLLVSLLFAILYGVVVAVGTYLGAGGAIPYLALAFGFLGLQFLIGPALVGRVMKVKWVTEEDESELHQMVTELAERANLPKPKVGISLALKLKQPSHRWQC